MEYYTMFPILCEEMKELIPEMYFGGMEVPAYLHAEADSTCSLEDVVSTIQSIGGNSSGYIDDKGIHFHIHGDEMIQVDLSKKFVFVSQPDVNGGELPSAWQVFRFLKEPASKALFITLGRATLVKKTEQTLVLCKELDRLWAEEGRFLALMVEMVGSEEVREKGLARMMKSFEEETLGSSSEMWEFWDTFGSLLMVCRLGLSVQTIQ